MFKAAVLSVLGLVAGMSGTVAQAQYFYSPVGYSYSGYYPVRPVYSAPVVVGVVPRYYAAPVVVARPVYVSPVVRTVYSAPVYTSSISTVSYSSEPTPVYSEPATSYYAPAPVVVSSAVYAPSYGYTSYRTGLFPSTLHSHTYGPGYSVHERSTPYRSVTRVRGW